jgi:serine protease Do
MFELAAGSGRSPYSIAGAEPVARRRSHGTRLVAMAMRCVFVTIVLAVATVGYSIAGAEPVARRRSHGTRVVAMAMRWVFVTMALAVAMVGSLSGSLFAVPAANADDHQTAIDQNVAASMVVIGLKFSGQVVVPASVTGDQAVLLDSVDAYGMCSGFVVDPAGYIATAGHRVDPTSAEVKAAIREATFEKLVDSGKLDLSTAKQDLAQANQQEWPVQGPDSGSPPDRVVRVIQPEGPGRVIDHAVTARVVDFHHTEDGDNALLSVSGFPALKALVISQKVPQPGQALTAVAFPARLRKTWTSRAYRSPATVRHCVHQQVSPNGVPTTEIGADLEHGMSGGPTVDNDTGEVLGVNSYYLRDINALNFITNAPILRSFLQKNGVQLATEPAPPKKLFSWLWIVVGSVGLVTVAALATIVMLIVMLLRRRHRHPKHPADALQVGAQLPQQYVPPQPQSAPAPSVAYSPTDGNAPAPPASTPAPPAAA